MDLSIDRVCSSLETKSVLKGVYLLVGRRLGESISPPSGQGMSLFFFFFFVQTFGLNFFRYTEFVSAIFLTVGLAMGLVKSLCLKG